jgi:hypothetical protein
MNPEQVFVEFMEPGRSRLSKLFRLGKTPGSRSVSICQEPTKQDALQAPSLHNTCENNLFRVVGNERSNLIDSMTEMAVGEQNHLGRGHATLQRLEYMCY